MRGLLPLLILAATSGGADAGAEFLPPGALDLTAILAPPPAKNSPETRAEIADIHRAQTQARPAEQAQAKADSEEDAFIFATVLGPEFTPGKLPIAAAFFREVQRTEHEFVSPAKKAWNRLRPPLVDAAIVPCKALSGSASYPSGHATTGYLMAIILARMVPEKRDAIFTRAAQFAHNRVVCGVHYPSDVEAGRISGTAIAAMLLDNPAFLGALSPARAEVRAALGLVDQ